MSLTGQNKIPNKFCSTRWVESSKCAYWSLEIIDNIHKFINDSLIKLPRTTIVKNVNFIIADKLIKPKLGVLQVLHR